MSSITGAAGGSVAGAAAQLQQPKKSVEKQPDAQVQAHVSTGTEQTENPSTLLAARAGLDFARFQKAMFNAIVDERNNSNETGDENSGFVSNVVDKAMALKPSDIAVPLKLDPSKAINPLIDFGKGVAESGKAVFDSARQAVTDVVNSYSEINDVGKLEEGDSIVMSGKGSIGTEVGAGEEVGMEIKCTKKDPQTGETEYTVTLEGAPEINGSVGGFGGSVGGGAKTEYKFKSAEEVERFMQITGKMTQANIAGANSITKEDGAFLNQHVSSVEFKTATGAQYDGKVGIGKGFEIGAQPGVKVQQSIRIEYENGKPVNLVRVTELSGTGVGRFGLNLFKSKSGGEPPPGTEPKGLSEINGKAIDAKGTITVETKIPLDKAELADVPTIIADPSGFALMDKAETSIKVAGEIDGGQYGGQYEMEISQVSGTEAKQIIEKTLQNKPEEAFQNVAVDVKKKFSVFEDKGLNINFDFKVGGVGVEYASRVEKRDVTVIAQSEQKDAAVSQPE